jgi:arsenite/tail-anchored protein-transporting ATPase
VAAIPLREADARRAAAVAAGDGESRENLYAPRKGEKCSVSSYTFFSGKGGVGKTTIAAATALRMADSGKKVLILSTDPASNLADVFERPIGHRIREILPNLHAMEIDPDAATEEYREHVIGPMRGVMPPDVMKVLEEQFRSACTVEIASFDRFTDFLGKTDFDAVIFDTAPTGHTIRLLELPVDWSRHIEESAKGSGQTCIGPVSSIQDSKEKYDRAVAAMRDPERTEFVLVCRPEATSVSETVRAHDELSALGIGNFRIVVNGIYPEDAGGPFAGLGNRQREQVRALSESLPYPRREVRLQAGEVKGVDPLRRFAEIVYEGRPDGLQGKCSGEEVFNGFSEPAALSEMLAARNGRRTVILTGKGGVGKTVAACAVAARMAGEGHKTLLVTTDPAAHIGQVLSVEVATRVRPAEGYPNLSVARIDQKASVEAYKEKILAQARSSGHSEEMLAAVKEELESPCTEEMAVFEEFSKMVEREDFAYVVFDTAPTGHTLRLLELPYDYARQVEMMVSIRKDDPAAGEARKKLDALVRHLKDRARCTFLLVLYPEYTPVFEAKRAAEDLRESGIGVQGVIANFVLDEKDCGSSFAVSRYFMQQHYLRVAEEAFRLPIFKVPMMEAEPAGKEALERVGRELLGPDNIVTAAAQGSARIQGGGR